MWDAFKEYIHVFWISMLPISELRGALIYAAAAPELNRFAALPVAIIGNILPVPFLLLFGQKLLNWFANAPVTVLPFIDRTTEKMNAALEGAKISTAERALLPLCRGVFKLARRFFAWFGELCTRISDKAQRLSKSERFAKYELLGLFLFVAIPSPGTGAWMGSLIATLLHIDRRKAVPVICAGVVLAGIIMTVGTSAVAGVVEAFQNA
ncbi:MAG: small multi-drug export protein [Oscillospiraceae bacterium]|nr:small multi-drug export protein [Oscillospiraceae bacterium]